MAIKKDDVFRVADQMFADGATPSLVGVRTALGSGSYSTISGFLAEWKSASRQAPVVGQDDAPDEVNEVFAPALRSMWAVAQSLALAEFDVQKLALADKLLDSQAKEKEAFDLVDLLQVQADAYIQKCLALQTDLEARIAQLNESFRTIGDLRARDDEVRKQHASLLAKMRPISLRKDRGEVQALPKK